MTDLFDQLAAPPALREGWQRVRASRGCAGLDGVTLAAFEDRLERHLADLREALLAGAYRPLPVLRYYLAKRGGGLRPLGIPTARDRVAQAAAVAVLQPLLEPLFLPCSYAYRPGRSWLDAVNALCRLRDRGLTCVARADIDSFFDTLDHQRLLRLLAERAPDPRLQALVGQWLTTPVCEQGHLQPVAAGVCQGGVISPLLSNLYLTPFDRALTAAGRHLLRYADDFVIACASEAEAAAALAQAGEVLAGLDLCLERSKCRLCAFASGFEFLGTQFVGRRRVLPAGGAGGYWRQQPPTPAEPLPPERLRHLWEQRLLPLSSVEEHAFCPRAAGLHLLAGETPETPLRRAGRAAEHTHQAWVRADPDSALHLEVPVVAPHLGLQGRLDAVQEKWGLRLPVEFRWASEERVSRPLAVKLAAAALALQEQGSPLPPLAYVDFLPSRRRVSVALEDDLLAEAQAQLAALGELLAAGTLPAPQPHERCHRCAYYPACLPEQTAELNRLLQAMIGGAARDAEADDTGGDC